MATHPYISGPGNVTQMIGFLRKNFPQTVNADTVRKYGLASKNESYVINVLQFLGLIEEDGKRTDTGHNVMTTHNEGEFQKAFADLIRASYEDLFSIRGDDAWKMSKDELISYFRGADKTSDIIGGRQAGVFIALRELAGFATSELTVSAKPKTGTAKRTKPPAKKVAPAKSKEESPVVAGEVPRTSDKGDVALTVRIEINLPAEGSQETYDAIFKSIRANLFP